MRIVQIADLHVRSIKRHSEYREIFKLLYAKLRSEKPDEIVILGDLCHTKLQLSPEIILLITEFLTELGKIAVTRIVIGNHDFSISMPGRMDNITPIVEIAKINNVFVWNKTSLYNSSQEGVKYAVFSLTDQDKHGRLFKEIKALKKISKDIVIALFHGEVLGGKLDNGLVVNGIDKGLFNDCDAVMLGDLHACQTLQEGGWQEKVITEKDLKKYQEDGWELMGEELVSVEASL